MADPESKKAALIFTDTADGGMKVSLMYGPDEECDPQSTSHRMAGDLMRMIERKAKLPPLAPHKQGSEHV